MVEGARFSKTAMSLVARPSLINPATRISFGVRPKAGELSFREKSETISAKVVSSSRTMFCCSLVSGLFLSCFSRGKVSSLVLKVKTSSILDRSRSFISAKKPTTALALVSKYVPILTREEKKEALLSAIAILNSHGITSYTDAAIGPGGEAYSYGVMSAEFVDIYKELLAQGELTARVSVLLLLGDYGALTYQDLENGLNSFPIPQDTDREWLQFPGVKLFADGIPLTYTSWMNEDYISGEAGHGCSVIPGDTDEEQRDNLIKMIKLVHSRGFQIVVHATGDRAIDATVDGYVEAMAEKPGGDPRHYVVHGDFISPETCKKLADIGGGVAMQPTIEAMISDFDPAVVGDERAAYEWPMRTTIDSGCILTSSSDAPITVPNWRLGIENAVLRESLVSGAVSGPEESITVEEAIRSYTINGAWQDHMEDIKGSIEVGKLADFCIIDKDILTIDPHEIKTATVLKTIVNGKVVFEA